MKKQILAFTMAVISIGSLNTIVCSANYKELDMSIMNSNEEIKNVDVLVQSSIDAILERQVEERIEQERILKNKRIEQEKILKEKNRIANVRFDKSNVTIISNITYKEMASVLKNTGFENFSNVFVDAEKQYGINAFLLVAIPSVESGWNKSERAGNGRNNIVGMNVKNDTSYGSVYESKYDCIMDLARQLNKYYLNPNGNYYKGLSTKDINFYYSTTKTWYNIVNNNADYLVKKYNKLYRK